MIKPKKAVKSTAQPVPSQDPSKPSKTSSQKPILMGAKKASKSSSKATESLTRKNKSSKGLSNLNQQKPRKLDKLAKKPRSDSSKAIEADEDYLKKATSNNTTSAKLDKLKILKTKKRGPKDTQPTHNLKSKLKASNKQSIIKKGKQKQDSKNLPSIQSSKIANDVGNFASILSKQPSNLNSYDNELTTFDPSDSERSADDLDSPEIAQDEEPKNLLNSFRSIIEKSDSTVPKNNQLIYNEEDENQFNILHGLNQDNQEDLSDINELLDKLGDDEEFGDLRYQLEILKNNKNTPTLKELPTITALQKAQQKSQYAATKKDMAKWLPLIHYIQDAPHLDFGKPTQKLVPKLDSVRTFKAEDDFEKEIDEALKISGTSNNEIKNSKEFDTIQPIKDSITNEHAAQLRALMLREQQRNKRLSKIKSKLWHKIHKKSEQRQKEKLMSRLEVENPELAAKLRKEYEEKYAVQRLQRRTMARKKWSETAQRFGGKEMRSVISKQKQIEHDDKKAVQQIVKSKPFGADESDSDPESLSETEDKDQSMSESKSLTHKTKLEALRELKHSHEPLPQKGLFALKFMKNAIEKHRESFQNEANEFIETLQKMEEKDLENEENISEDEHETENIASQTNNTLPKFSKDEMNKAMEEIDSILNNKHNESDPTQSIESNGNVGPEVTAHKLLNGNTTSDKQDGIDQLELLSKLYLEDTPSEHLQESSEITQNTKNDSKINNSSPNQKEEQMQQLLDKITPDVDDEQLKLISQTFITGDSSQINFIKDFRKNENIDDDEIKNNETLGWGSWTGYGTSNKTRKPSKNKKVNQPKKVLISVPAIINKKKDKKAQKYALNEIPFPYTSAGQYELNFQQPIGREWNSLRAHKSFIQPKVNVRLGSVLHPIQFSDQLSGENINSYLKSWNKTRISQRTKAKL